MKKVFSLELIMIDLETTFFKNLIWLNTKEAAEYLRITPNNLRVMVYRGVLFPYKLNNRNRFKKIELDKLIESSKRETKS